MGVILCCLQFLIHSRIFIIAFLVYINLMQVKTHFKVDTFDTNYINDYCLHVLWFVMKIFIKGCSSCYYTFWTWFSISFLVYIHLMHKEIILSVQYHFHTLFTIFFLHIWPIYAYMCIVVFQDLCEK